MISSKERHDRLLNNLIERYRNEGYNVVREPGPNALPFDLGGYRPDLLAQGQGSNLIVEVRTEPERISYDRLRAIAEEVKRHQGWRFLLVTSQDVDDSAPPDQAQETFSWQEAAEAIAHSQSLSSDAPVLGFMRLWVVFEKMMRFRARSISLPVDRLASLPIMIAQLYSHGEFSAQQFELAKNLVAVRNQVFHGFDLPNLAEHFARLNELVRETRDEWSKDEI